MNDVDQIEEQILRKKLIKETGKLTDMLIEKRSNSEFLEQLNYLATFIKDSENNYIPINDTFNELYRNQKEINGLSFMCQELDKRTGGILPGTVTTLVGAPGSMKTTTVVNIAYNAVKQGKNVCYLSLEETAFQLYGKLLSRVSVDYGKKLSTQDITQNNLNGEDKEVLLKEIQPHFESLPGTFYIVEEGDLGVCKTSTIESKLKVVDNLIKIKSKEKQNDEEHGIDLLVVDHIQILKYTDDSKIDEFQLINMYVSFFRQQALSFLHEKRKVSVILLSQVNREGIAYAQKKTRDKDTGQYLMQHVAESSEIERSSTYIISVYTDGECQVSKLLKFGAIKLRNAQLPLGTINVFADGEYYQVGDSKVKEQADYSMNDIELTPIQVQNNYVSNLDNLLMGFEES